MNEPAMPAASREPHNGDSIAYSTAPANDQEPRAGYGYPTGSDIFLVRRGGGPKLVAGRGDGKTWNVCPVFSPDGTKLAFGTKTPGGRAVRVVGVSRTGAIIAPSIDLRVPGRGLGPCPKWSSDGLRLAYVRERTAISGRTLIIRALDGSSPRAASGDPVIKDFSRSKTRILSPSGNLAARLVNNQGMCEVVVARPDGSSRRVLKDLLCPYAVAGWSPDGRQIIVMQDIDGSHFTMNAVSVDAPYDIVPIVVQVRVNHGRSWPGYGDVSWQSRP
jgi:Tol biopolymer transport system component